MVEILTIKTKEPIKNSGKNMVRKLFVNAFEM
jgi:hypothetical protein